jgi:hypothetical protein
MTHFITSEMIAEAKAKTRYGNKKCGVLHEHDDCIRMAYEWLDAQKNTKVANTGYSLKGYIERWCGRYVSSSDVDIAITLHPRFFAMGYYGICNLSRRHIEPDIKRLEGIVEAFKHDYRRSHKPYTRGETRYLNHYNSAEFL